MNTAGLELAEHKRKRSADEECEYEIPRGLPIGVLVGTAIVIEHDTLGHRTTRHRPKRRTVSVKKYGHSESLWMGNTLQGIATVTTNIEQALQLSLNEHEDDGLLLSQKHMLESLEELASFKTYVIFCGAKEEVYTGKWENIAEKWREVERLQIFEAPCTIKRKHTSACTQRIEHVCPSTFYNSLSDMHISRPLILPSSYTGSDRFMQQLFQDSMAIVRHFGKPSLYHLCS